MSRSGTLFDAVAITDSSGHLGTTPIVTGSGTTLRDDTTEFISIGTESEVIFTVVNDLAVSVDVLFEGFTVAADDYVDGDLDDDANWDTIDTLTVAAGDDDTQTVTNTLDDSSGRTIPLYEKVRATATAASSHGLNEVQTINLGDIAAADTFTLTFNAHATSVLTFANDIHTQIQDALIALTDFDAGDLVVTRTSASVYVVTFGGNRANQNVGAITITNATGFTPVGVTETNKGGDFSLTVTWTSSRGDNASSGIR